MAEFTFTAPERPSDHLPLWIEVPYFRLPTKSFEDNDLTKRLIKEAVDCLKIINTSLQCYRQGQKHMFKPIAVQLRILYCDKKGSKDNSLLTRLSPDIELLAFRPIQWEKASSNGMSLVHMARSPYFVSEGEGKISSSEINIDSPPRYLIRDEWLKQIIDLEPIEINVGQIIKAIVDKGGGAHIDSNEGLTLSAMKKNGPGIVKANEYFVIALAKYTLRLGEQFTWQVIDKGLLIEF